MKKIIKLLLLTFFLFSITWSGCSKNFSPFKKSDNDNSIEEWANIGLKNKPLGTIKLLDDYLYVCAYDSGLFRNNFNNDNIDWEFMGLSELGTKYYGVNDVTVLHDTILVCHVNGIYRSTDNGKNWHLSNTGIGRFKSQNTLAGPCNNSGIIFSGNSMGQIFISLNFGRTWQPSYDPYNGRGLLLSFETIQFNPNNEYEIWAGGELNGEYPLLIKTTDMGQTWDTIMDWNQGPEGEYVLDYISAICFDPMNDSSLYVGMHRVWKIKNDGSEWVEFFNIYPDSLSVLHYKALYSAIEINPQNSNEMWILENEGLYYTADRGEQWYNRSPQNQFLIYKNIAVDWDQQLIYLSTYNEGIWKLHFNNSLRSGQNE